jgi:hypothetical protein
LSPFELQVVSPQNPVIAPSFVDIQYAGVAYSAASNLILFGVSTWGDWSTPTDVTFNVYIDTNLNGTWDRILFNSNPGSMAQNLFGTAGATAQDTFLTGVFNLDAGRHGGVRRAGGLVADLVGGVHGGHAFPWWFEGRGELPAPFLSGVALQTKTNTDEHGRTKTNTDSGGGGASLQVRARPCSSFALCSRPTPPPPASPLARGRRRAGRGRGGTRSAR